MNTPLRPRVGARGLCPGPLSRPTCSKIIFADSKDAAPELLQEAEQSIIRYEKCNEILKKKLKSETNMVKKGTVCGYSALGKDSCQVSSWAFATLHVACHLRGSSCICIICQSLHWLFIQIKGIQGTSCQGSASWPDLVLQYRGDAAVRGETGNGGESGRNSQ